MHQYYQGVTMKGLVLDFSNEKTFKTKSLQNKSKRNELEKHIENYWNSSVFEKIDVIYKLSDLLAELFGLNKETNKLGDGFPDSDNDLIPELAKIYNDFQELEFEKVS